MALKECFAAPCEFLKHVPVLIDDVPELIQFKCETKVCVVCVYASYPCPIRFFAVGHLSRGYASFGGELFYLCLNDVYVTESFLEREVRYVNVWYLVLRVLFSDLIANGQYL